VAPRSLGFFGVTPGISRRVARPGCLRLIYNTDFSPQSDIEGVKKKITHMDICSPAVAPTGAALDLKCQRWQRNRED
jgi:hypothetical protein